GGKRGLFETAHTGTLFLDEIGDMPLSLQTRLLRVLQEREITRVGGVAPIPVDVRVIAATHQPLQEMIAERRFRQDLYYRINTLRLALPPLRERPGDIGALAHTLLARSLTRLGSSFDAAEVLAPLTARLAAYAWPGNVRELENIAERIAVYLLQFDSVQFDSRSAIDYDGLREDCPELYAGEPAGAELDLKTRLAQELERNNGNRALAAQKLGISRSTVWRWMREQEGGAGDAPTDRSD
ncbi:MAG: propionate catabolism operon regulatory protein PrpR, partial [Massilia sp.]|nr:propionate catabolism operon regulatory protein PrpR [Massilia sp.]